MSNAQDGWDTLLNWLCGHGQWTSVSIRSSQAGATDWIQELHFREGVKTSRLVRVMWDDRPEFFASGEPLFCEEPELYTARSVRARLTRAALGRYLGRLGLPVSLPGFWASGEEAIYLRRSYPVPASGQQADKVATPPL